MTTPQERMRSLRWGWELLSVMQLNTQLSHELRNRAAAIMQPYPNPETLQLWVQIDISRIPADAAEAIEAAGELFTKLEQSGCLDDELRRCVHYTRRHFPQVGRAAEMSETNFLLGVTNWIDFEPP